MERTLSNLIQDLIRLGEMEPGRTRIYSLAYGPVLLESVHSGSIAIRLRTGEIIQHDHNGKLGQDGVTLLYPEQGKDWGTYYRDLVKAGYDKKLKPGEVCLVKQEYSNPWTLAVFSRVSEVGGYVGKTGLEEENFMFAVSWEDNKPLLGRCQFPEGYWTGQEDGDGN